MDAAAVRNQAMLALGQREYSRKELQKKLVSAGGDINAVDAVLDELMQLGYLNPQRFAEALVSKRARQGYGPRWIRQELQQAAIESDIIGGVLDNGGHDWPTLAGKLYRKKYGNKSAPDLKEKARRARFLFAKGFSSDQLKHFLQGAESFSEDACED